MAQDQHLKGQWHNAVGALAETAFKYQSQDPNVRRNLANNALTDMVAELAQKRGIGIHDEQGRNAVKAELAAAFGTKEKIVASREHYLRTEKVCRIPELRPGALG
jgi:hypothetical protein